MKLSGDVSEKDRELAEHLDLFERQIEGSVDIEPEYKAQVYTCLAHDWYQINVEEEGHRLLLKAEAEFPGYFKELIFKHAENDKDFDKVVKNLTLELAYLLMVNMDKKRESFN